MKKSQILTGALVAALLPISAVAQIRNFAGYDANSVPRNDDLYTSLVDIGFTTNFFGISYSKLFVNNNGNVTFDAQLGTYTPFNLYTAGRVIIAPFFGDVDTRGSDSSLVTYGSGSLGGHNAFAANYLNVGVFSYQPIYNTFQVVLVDRSETGAGNFDFEFNYTDINWEAGTASGAPAGGLGGTAARAGYSNGTQSHSFELLGSGVNGAFLDSNPEGLIYNRLGTPFDGASMAGRYVFQVRNGNVLPPSGAVPEPSTYGVIGAAVLLLGLAVRRFRRQA